jgi:glycosyltransferase involved in cell wall biosynthesis
VRILLISNVFPPGFLGGYELGALDVARGLQRAGHEVRVLTSDYFPDDDNQMPELPAERVLQCTEPSRALIPVSLNLQRGLYMNSHNVRMLAQSVLRFSPDRVVCFNLLGLGVLGIIRYLVSAGLPPVIYLMDDIFKDLRNAAELRRRFLHVFGNLDFVKAADFVMMSANLAEQVETSLGMPVARKVIIPGWFNAGPAGENRPWTGNKANHIVRFVYASRVAPHKGIDLTVDAVRGVLERGRSDFVVDVFGAGDVTELLQAVTAYGIGDHLRYQGCPAKEELLLRYREYDAMLFPTREQEPFGFVVSEAAWARCIPVMTAGIGAGEWFLDNWDSLKISRTASDLTAAMLKLLAMPPAERDLMQRRAQRTASHHLQFDRAMGTIQEVIAQQSRERTGPSNTARTAELAIEVLDDMWGRISRV